MRAAAIVLLLMTASAGQAVAAPGATTTPAVSTAIATPATFVPDWDGHSDTTVLQYALVERSVVRIDVLDGRGSRIASIAAGRRAAGMHLATWDGRTRAGEVVPPGSYRIRVAARPVAPSPGDGTPGSAGLGGATVVAGVSRTAVRVQAPPVALRGVRLGRATLGRSARASRTSVQFDLSSAATISAAIVRRDASVVRTLAVRPMRAGANRLLWNGRGADGTALPDGEYQLLVAARRSGRPTATTRLPLRVDRTVPTLRLARRARAKARTSGVTIPVHVTLGEQATVRVQLGARSERRTLAAGSHRLRISGRSLGIRPSRRTRSVTLRVTVTDAAGNAVTRLTRVQVPPVVRVAAPRPERPTPAPPAGTGGALSWPIVGIVTSEFGMRSGRMHTGIDIGAPTGTPIHPVAPARVSYVGVLGGYGNLVILEHPGGMRTYYAHMSRFGAFGVGDQVVPGDVIGEVGCTGTCSGPHIHFETRIGDVPSDPRGFLQAR